MELDLNYQGDVIPVLKIKEQVPLLEYTNLEETGLVTHAFTTRLGGVSKGDCQSMNLSTTRGDEAAAIAENTRRLSAALTVDGSRFVYTNQTHTTNVAQVLPGDEGKVFAETDGLITNVPGITLVTFYADCVPLFFLDPRNKAIGLSHSGWRGTVGKMGKVTITKMTEAFGSRPEDLICAIGPSICQTCYEVSEDVIIKVQEAFPNYQERDLYYRKENGKYQLNLWRANELVLLEAGVKKEKIATTTLCTSCNDTYLFSHRKMGTNRGNLSALMTLR